VVIFAAKRTPQQHIRVRDPLESEAARLEFPRHLAAPIFASHHGDGRLPTRRLHGAAMTPLGASVSPGGALPGRHIDAAPPALRYHPTSLGITPARPHNSIAVEALRRGTANLENVG
jgi:hypothetical protein